MACDVVVRVPRWPDRPRRDSRIAGAMVLLLGAALVVALVVVPPRPRQPIANGHAHDHDDALEVDEEPWRYDFFDGGLHIGPQHHLAVRVLGAAANTTPRVPRGRACSRYNAAGVFEDRELEAEALRSDIGSPGCGCWKPCWRPSPPCPIAD